MREHQEEFELAVMSRALDVSRSGFYSGSQTGDGLRAVENEQLGVEIERIHLQSRGHYGSPRVKMALDKEGRSCGLNRVAKIMRKKGLQGVRQSRKKVKTTDSNHEHSASPNLLKGLEITGPNQVWAADITYIRTDEGWVYLAAVIDLYSRKIVGWDMADTLEAGVVIRALQQALATRDWKPGLIHHSDRGVQYACKDFRQLLEENGIVQSMSAKGNCYDNATMESFFGTLKAEEGAHYPDWQSARLAIFNYLETYYNRTRIHTSLGGCSPEEFEAQAEHSALERTPAPLEPAQPKTLPLPQSLPSHEFSEASDAPLVSKAAPEPQAQPEEGSEPEGQAGASDSHDRRPHHPEYPLEGCSPAEPSSVSSRQAHKDSKLILEQVKRKH